MSGFTFKRFHVNHDRCAMKVGTDGVLLGSWANAVGPRRILDLGTGSGLVALMLAQRYPQAAIEAVESEPNASSQARENIENSPFSAQITLYRQDIVDFARKCAKKFDLITANPPYFAQGAACATMPRELARYVRDSHFVWLNIAASLLSENGTICFILPFEAGEILKKQTALFAHDLFIAAQCDVVTKSGKNARRILLKFSRHPATTRHSRLLVYDENNRYSTEFTELTKDFYLKM